MKKIYPTHFVDGSIDENDHFQEGIVYSPFGIFKESFDFGLIQNHFSGFYHMFDMQLIPYNDELNDFWILKEHIDKLETDRSILSFTIP